MREEGSGTRKEAGKQLRNAGINLDKLKIIASIENQETIKKSVNKEWEFRSYPDLRRKKKQNQEIF